MKVYLCSRVAYDARPLNDDVAKSLRAAGFEVYVPHEQAPNNLSADDIKHGRYDKETIFRIDHAAMKTADICVAVGRMGADCSWELGWFAAKDVPVFFAPGDEVGYKTSPMLLPTLLQNPPIQISHEAGKVLRGYFPLPVVVETETDEMKESA